MLLNPKKATYFVKLLIWPSIALAVFAYFVYHLVSGDRGLISYLSLKKETVKRDKIIESLSVKKEDLEKEVDGLSDPLDTDLLEERVRHMLGFGRDKEITIIYSEEKK